jgi:Calcineurin-like phosphoesterase
MRILLLHLSDIHIKSDGHNNPVLNRVDKLSAAVISSMPSTDYFFILVTGDIAFSGGKSEYQISAEFLEKFKRPFEDQYGIEPSFVLVPGNHDCDFTCDDSIRTTLLKSMSPSSIDSVIVSKCASVQENFFEFRNSFCQTNNNINMDINEVNTLLTIMTFSFNNYLFPCNITFQLINSAWMSTRKEQQGKLLFPLQFLPTNHEPAIHPNAVITMFHHPYNWFEANNARDFRKAIELTSDVILTGHEHEDSHYLKTFSNGASLEYFEGGVLQESGDPDISSFNAIILDLDEQKVRSIRYCWTDNSHYVPEDFGWHPFQRNKQRLRRDFEVSSDFTATLNDPGAKYTHPAKEAIFLQDIFVYPDLRELNTSAKKTKRKIIQHELVKGENIVSLILNHGKVLIAGEDKSGKTMLARTLFTDLSTLGMTTIFMQGDHFSSVNEEKIINTIAREFMEQYSKDVYERFRQLDRSKRAIIIDDYHRCRLNNAGRQHLLSILANSFDKIILLGANEVCLEELFNSDTDAYILWKFKHYEIMPFGNVLRSELIKKWYYLGHVYTEDESEIHTKIFQAEDLISTLLGRNFLPSYPMFILLMLQQLQVKDALRTTSGTFGYLYEILITTSLSRSSSTTVDLDTKYNYLTEFAFHIFTKKLRAISENEMLEWHEAYCRSYQLYINFELIESDLIKAGIFNRGNGLIRFNYKYIYYFFVGRYFRDHITEDEIKQHIEAMSRRLHHEETANIIIFLSYLSKDPFILTTMLNASKQIFSSYDRCDLGKDTAFFNELMLQDPMLRLKNSNIEENRLKLNEQRDLLRDIDSDIIREEDEDESSEVISDEELPQDSIWINAAFKTIQILGQVLRNFPGSLKGDVKFTLAEECYSLGLRVLTVCFDMFKEHQDNMIRTIAAHISENEPDRENEEIVEEIKMHLFTLLEAITLSVIKHVSNSVGLEKLSPTFTEVLKRNAEVSIQIIDLCVKLDHYRDLPELEINKIYRSEHKNRFSSNLVRLMVWYHLYLRPVKQSQRQQICSKLGIELSPKMLKTGTKREGRSKSTVVKRRKGMR